MASNNGNNKSAEEVKKAQELTMYCRYTLGLTPVDRHDVIKIESRIKAFFEYCQDTETVANVMALALALGISKDTFYQWRNGNTKDLAPGVSDSIKKACQMIESNTLTNIQTGGINPLGGTVVLNNNFDYKQAEQKISMYVKPQQSIDQLQSKYSGLVLDAPECPPVVESGE